MKAVIKLVYTTPPPSILDHMCWDRVHAVVNRKLMPPATTPITVVLRQVLRKIQP